MKEKLLRSKPMKFAITIACIFSIALSMAACGDSSQSLATANETIEQNETKLAESETQIKDLEQKLQDYEDQSATIDSLKEELEKVKSDYQLLQEEQTKDKDTIGELNTKIKSLQASAEAASTNVSTGSEVEEADSYPSTQDVNAAETDSTVHITKTGSKYHNAGCRYLKESDIATSLSEATAQGHTPCSVCH